jgi:hypothetical protein
MILENVVRILAFRVSNVKYLSVGTSTGVLGYMYANQRAYFQAYTDRRFRQYKLNLAKEIADFGHSGVNDTAVAKNDP